MLKQKLARFISWMREPMEEQPPPPQDISPIYRRVRKPRDNSHLHSLEAYADYFNQVARRPINHTVTWQRYYISKKFRPNPGDVILDFGFYLGTNLIRYAKEGHQIDGIEVALAYARTFEKRLEAQVMAQEEWDRIRTFIELIETFKPDRLYDRILCCELLEHVIDPVVILKKAHECLKEGGEIFIAVPKDKRFRTDIRDVSLDDLEAWLKEAGFREWRHEEIQPEKYEDGSKDWGVAQLITIATK